MRFTTVKFIMISRRNARQEKTKIPRMTTELFS